jgi:hypothetical protein
MYGAGTERRLATTLPVASAMETGPIGPVVGATLDALWS